MLRAFVKKRRNFIVKLCILLTKRLNLMINSCYQKSGTAMEVSSMDAMDYVKILRDLREDADKTQTQIAEVLGTSQTMYARY